MQVASRPSGGSDEADHLHPMMTGGEEGIRTPDLPDANRSLFHLSYNPIGSCSETRTQGLRLIRAAHAYQPCSTGMMLP